MVIPSDGWGATEVLEVDAHPEVIWPVVSDLARHPALAGSEEVLTMEIDGPVAPGTTFKSDIRTGERGSFTARGVVDAVDAPSRFAWTSLPPLDPGETDECQIEVHWALELTDLGDGSTRVEHSVRIPVPAAGGDWLADFMESTGRMATVAEGMRRTLRNLADAVSTAD